MFTSPARGVTQPKNQGMPANQGPSNTVISVVPCEFVAVQYYDRDGRLTNDVLMLMGGEYYAPPNSVEWAKELHPVHTWLSNGIKKRIPQENAAPAEDSVDIFVSSLESKTG